jgi:hypothetical protein
MRKRILCLLVNLSYVLLVQLTYPVYLYDKYLKDFEEHNQELKTSFY